MTQSAALSRDAALRARVRPVEYFLYCQTRDATAHAAICHCRRIARAGAVAWISGLPAGVPVDMEFIGRELHRRQLGYGRGGRQTIEKDQADILAGSAAREDDRRAHRAAHRKSRLEKLGEGAARGRQRWRGRRAAPSDGAAAGPRGSGRRAEIQFPRCALHAGARVGARNGGARGGGRAWRSYLLRQFGVRMC